MSENINDFSSILVSIQNFTFLLNGYSKQDKSLDEKWMQIIRDVQFLNTKILEI